MSAQENAQAQEPRRGPMGHGPGGRMMPGEKPKNLKGTLAKLIAFMGRFKAAIVVVLVFAVGSTIFNIVGPKVLSTATTELFNGIVAKIDGSGGIDFDAIARILVFTLGLYLLSAACSFVQGWIMSSVSQRTCYQLRGAIADKIDRMPMGYFERTSVGDTLSRITNDVDTLGQSLNQGVTQLITSVTTIVGVLIMMLSINPLMTLITVVILPVSIVLIMVVVKRSQKYFVAQQRTLGKINGIVEETFSGHAIVKAFNREDGTVDRFNETNAKLYGSAWKSQFFSGLMQPIMTFVGNLGYVAVAIAGSFLAVQGIITVGDIQAFIQYVKNFTQPITQLTQVSNVLQQMAAAAERIFEFLDAPEEEPDHATARTADVECNVQFDHVRFGYDPEKPVIKDFSAQVSEGQTVALVGPTGAGKTTMVKLLMRFYDVQSGCIKIGGTDIRDFARDDLRSLFGMVLQDTWLFHGTIRDNIAYGRPDATTAEIVEAAKRANIDAFVRGLSDGDDTYVGERGARLSGGQKQRIAIARVFLKDPRILILDEATSALDNESERAIQKSLEELSAGRTTLVIAHRLSTIRGADLIAVVEDGRVAERGTHEQLLALGGTYAHYYEMQFGPVEQGAVL
ncbi:MAG: ABC transporter ATP-binding protein [Eggerthella sp.]|nr:ABC transporter ATP-binding protein [Eggerthella sp.]